MPVPGLGGGLPGFWRWWTQALASWLPPRWRSLLGMGRSRLLLQQEAGSLRVRAEMGDGLREVLQLPAGDGALHAQLDAVLRPALREAPRWWLLPAAKGLRRTLEVPAAAASRLREVTGFEIERQTPFTADSVYHDARVLGPGTRPGTVRAELAVVPRDVLAPLLQAAGAGPLDGIDLADSSGTPLGLNLLPPAERSQRRDALRLWHWLLGVFALLMTIAWMWQLLDNRRSAADELEARVSLLAEQARTASIQRQQLVGLIEGQAFLDASRQRRPTNVEVIEELARRLPDGTSLERLAVEGERLLLTGQSGQAAALVGQMEGSPLWRSPALSGALQADARTRRDRFTLVAELITAPAVAPASVPVAGGVVDAP